jgi:hypothetical protein
MVFFAIIVLLIMCAHTRTSRFTNTAGHYYLRTDGVGVSLTLIRPRTHADDVAHRRHGNSFSEDAKQRQTPVQWANFQRGVVLLELPGGQGAGIEGMDLAGEVVIGVDDGNVYPVAAVRSDIAGRISAGEVPQDVIAESTFRIRNGELRHINGSSRQQRRERFVRRQHACRDACFDALKAVSPSKGTFDTWFIYLQVVGAIRRLVRPIYNELRFRKWALESHFQRQQADDFVINRMCGQMSV